ncbi:MAG: hypothetical protein PVH99_08840 [Desulfobacteraceae bacterium]|jgi:hypothetical protein
MEQERPKRSFRKRAANASWIIPLIGLGALVVTLELNESTDGDLVFAILFTAVFLLSIMGIIFAIMGIFGRKPHGAKPTIVPSAFGIILNGALIGLYIWCAASAFRGVSIAQHSIQPSNAMMITMSPNPCDVHSSSAFHEKPYPYMWYYRTEVKNILPFPLQITWFATFYWVDDEWVLREEFEGDVFASWYTEGDPCPNGIIQPGQTAVRDPSMQGSPDPKGGISKWAYIARDPGGQEYYLESVVELVPFTK